MLFDGDAFSCMCVCVELAQEGVLNWLLQSVASWFGPWQTISHDAFSAQESAPERIWRSDANLLAFICALI